MTKDKVVYINDIITEDYLVPSSKYNGKYTKTALFLLPMLNLTTRDSLISKYFKNAFLNDAGIEHDFTKSLFILFKVRSFKEKSWTDMCNILKTQKPFYQNYIMDYVVGTEDNFNLVMFVFKVPEEYHVDYLHFVGGRYSEFSNNYKSKFPEFLTTNGKKSESIVYGVIHKTATLKKIVAKEFSNNIYDEEELLKEMNNWKEIWDKVYLNQETYRYGNTLS